MTRHALLFHITSEQAALKVLYLVIRDKKKGGGNITARLSGWSKALNALAIAYGVRSGWD